MDENAEVLSVERRMEDGGVRCFDWQLRVIGVHGPLVS